MKFDARFFHFHPVKLKEDDLFLPSMTADRLAGGPFKSYLKSKNNLRCLANLQFWEDVQAYTAMTTSTVVDLKFRLGRNLIVTYLQRGSIREVKLDGRLRERLCYLLRRGQADMILSKVADGILEVSQKLCSVMLFRPLKADFDSAEILRDRLSPLTFI